MDIPLHRSKMLLGYEKFAMKLIPHCVTCLFIGFFPCVSVPAGDFGFGPALGSYPTGYPHIKAGWCSPSFSDGGWEGIWRVRPNIANELKFDGPAYPRQSSFGLDFSKASIVAFECRQGFYRPSWSGADKVGQDAATNP
jgi:hypothetical protein